MLSRINRQDRQLQPGRILGVPGGSPRTISLIGPGPGFDSQYAMSADLDEPLIIASVTAGGSGQVYPLLIDGYAPLRVIRCQPRRLA